MTWTLKDFEDHGVVDEFVRCFDTEHSALALIRDLNPPPGSFRPFTSMATGHWWRHVVEQLDQGLVVDGLERLLEGAIKTYPANRIFAEFKASASTPLPPVRIDPPSSSEASSSPASPGPKRDTQKQSLSVFLSYAREDRKVVSPIYRRLQREGFQPWMADYDVLPGQARAMAIRKAVEAVDVFLVLLSGNSSKRGFVHKEIRMGIDVWDERPEGDVFMIPALLEPAEIPDRLRDIESVELYEDGGLLRLVEALRILSRQVGK